MANFYLIFPWSHFTEVLIFGTAPFFGVQGQSTAFKAAILLCNMEG